MTKVIAIANQKGGVGKTSTAVNLGAGLVREGNDVLLIDLDAQANLTMALGFQNPDEMDYTISDVLLKAVREDNIDPAEGILTTEEGIDLMIRLNGGVHSIANASHYRKLRKVNYLHYINRDKGMTDYQSAEIIAEELNMTVNKVCAMISEGRCFRDFESLAERERDLSDEDAPDVYDKHDKGDRTADPGIVVPNALFMDEVIDAIQVLPYKQQQMLHLSSGISCIACGRICNRRTYAELANGFELYSESAVEKQRKQAIRKLRGLFL